MESLKVPYTAGIMLCLLVFGLSCLGTTEVIWWDDSRTWARIVLTAITIWSWLVLIGIIIFRNKWTTEKWFE